MLYCPNYTCQTPNPEAHKFCQKCRTPLPRHYLWAVGESAIAIQPGDLLANRYLCKSSRIFLDTKPGLYPTASTEPPSEFIPYLRLSPYQLHIPQVYEVLVSTTMPPIRILLLDHPALIIPVVPDTAQAIAQPELLPTLTDVWQGATALRQLHWLWQIAHLWQPLQLQQVASTLLAPELVRVEAGILRLLELRFDHPEPAMLTQLGQLWLEWTAIAQPEIRQGLSTLCQQLLQGQIRNAEQIIGQLDTMLATVGRSTVRQIQIATRTDQGPSRQRNEDACYPPGGTVKPEFGVAASDQELVIVCDGIGGHQGGDVASNLAIESVRQQVQALAVDNIESPTLMVQLERAIGIANDVISQRNDSEQRFERQRMGTTLVMGLIRAHELYITHVGDSRAYRITRSSCRQITQDDDVASREVRLGYSSYREALQQPSSGSLIQALGMSSSAMLNPTVQRFILDEDSIFLLCSDGLSDNDRVEEYWDSLLLPVLEGHSDLTKASRQLIELANKQNGHDNVTIGLLYIQVRDTQTTVGGRTEVRSEAIAPSPSPALALSDPFQANVSNTTGFSENLAKTQVLSIHSIRKQPVLPALLGIFLLIGGGSLLLYSLSFGFRNWIDTLIGLNPPPVVSPSPTNSSPSPSLVPLPSLQVGSFVQLMPVGSTNQTNSSRPVTLFVQPDTQANAAITAVPAGSIVQVLRKQATTSQERWVQLRVCSMPTTPNVSAPSVEQTNETPSGNLGESFPDSNISPSDARSPTILTPSPSSVPLEGWVQETVILPIARPKTTLNTLEKGTCIYSSPPIPSSSATDVS